MRPIHVLALVSGTLAQSSPTSGVGCEGGACPSNFDLKEDHDCGMWLGPSNVKKAFQHGFGLGMFTGKTIQKGTAIEPLYNGGGGTVGEPLLPFWGSERIIDDHTPLREYIWDEDNMPEVAVEYPLGLTSIFIPGLAAIAPCTAVNFNLMVLGPGKEDGQRQSVVSSTTIPDNGAYAVRHNVSYVAVRDIAAGEELTVECSDDNYDGGAYYLSKFDPTNEQMICIDNNVRVALSTIQGHGLFAKKLLEKDNTILSSPVLPIHTTDLDIDFEEPINEDQLILNYCFGHPDSNLLWLPYGPLVNYINHSPQPNARIQWHTSPQASDSRQQYHHPELFSLPAEVVSKTHGKSLTLDIVALRPIQPNEEITIDYGPDWVKAWKDHSRRNRIHSLATQPSPKYTSAEAFNAQLLSLPAFQYSTITEQLHNPYPDNLDTFCFYALVDHPGTKLSHDDLHRHQRVHSHQWQEDQDHLCFRPCEILERSAVDNTYTVKFSSSDDPRVVTPCILDNHEVEIWTQVPARAIRIVDRPYSTEVFSQDAFRWEMALPDDMVPAVWKRNKLRGGGGGSGTHLTILEDGLKFKRKKTIVTLKIKNKDGTVVKEISNK